MHVEKGKYYRDGNGRVIGPLMFTGDDGEFLHLVAEVYVSDTPPTIITFTPGSSGGGGGMTPDTPRVGFAPPDQRQTADAPAPGYKTLRDEFASDWMKGVLANPNQSDSDPESFARCAYIMADAMMEARKK